LPRFRQSSSSVSTNSIFILSILRRLIHSVMLISPALVDRFKAIAPELERLFQSLGPANCALHAVPLLSIDELRAIMFYSSKLLKQPASVLGGLSKQHWESGKFPDEPRRSHCDIDLYTVLPKAKSEPVYVKSDWERELEAALKEARAHGQLTKCGRDVQTRGDARPREECLQARQGLDTRVLECP
jgi:hypothetical protein